MAVNVYREHGPCNKKLNVGHIPIELSSTLRFFAKYGGNISAKVRQETYRASNLEQGGLKITITVKCMISGQKRQLMSRLKQLVKKRWRDPRDFKENEHTTPERNCARYDNMNANIAMFNFVLQHSLLLYYAGTFL